MAKSRLSYYRKRDMAARSPIPPHHFTRSAQPTCSLTSNRVQCLDARGSSIRAADDRRSGQDRTDRRRGWRNRGMIRLYQGDNKAAFADSTGAAITIRPDAYSWSNRGQGQEASRRRQGRGK